MKEYGIQLYSLRDITRDDMEGTLKRVSDIGYKYVEFAGFFGNCAEKIKKWLDRYNLSCSGTHTGWQELVDDFDGTVKYHKIIGNKNIIIPGADLSTKEKLDDFIDVLNDLKPRLAAEGISLAYHNHSGEFLPTSYGQIIHTELEKRTDIDFEIDTYWAYHAGVDPIALLERLRDRIHVIHIKDGLSDGSGKPLGLGTAPVAAVHKKAEECGMLQVVESETLTPDGITEARLCFEELMRLDGSDK